MGPSPSWTPLSNLRLMAHYPSPFTGNQHILTSIWSGIVTITSQPNLVSSTPSPIGPKQCAASLSCSNMKRTTSGRLSLNANILNGLCTRWRKDSTGLPVMSLMGLTTKALQLPKLSLMKSKLRVTLSYPTHKVLVKASKDLWYIWHSNPLQRWQYHQEPPGLPQGQRPYGQPKWCHILVSVWWPRLWGWIHRGNLQDLWWKIQGTPGGPLSYSSPHQPNRPPH